MSGMSGGQQMLALICLGAPASPSRDPWSALASSAMATTTRGFPSPYPAAGAEASNVSTLKTAKHYVGRSSCIVRVLECKGVQYSNVDDRVNCFAHEIENTVEDRAVSLVSATTPYLWPHFTFENGVLALIMDASTVSVAGGWPEDRCGYSRGTPPEREKCHGTPQTPEEYAYDRLERAAASCGDAAYCSIAKKRASDCFTSKEDAWRKNAMWLRFLAQNDTRCGNVPLHNQLMAEWQVSDITAIGYSKAEHPEAAHDILRFIHARLRLRGVSTTVRLVQFKPDMGSCVAECCTDPRTSAEQIRKLVARTQTR
jgi:hypothetical protein